MLNHSAETDILGPTLSFRGLDNASYYRLDPADPRRYLDWSGCGNTIDLSHPRVMQLAMDALRHWASLGVDGFRFDLAPTLGRERDGGFAPDAPLLQAIAQDPVLGRLKQIAEPWDLGPHGYQQGRFPPPFAMWNDRFRDAVRRFWRGDEAMLPELAGRLLGSADLYEAAGRRPQAGINLITSHDGSTLTDLVSYVGRHNEANGEGNRDGHHDNLGANWGVEGPTERPEVRELRDRHRRNLLATLLLAQGTPMLLMGDELGRTQQGNNNAYCQDNALSWCDWGQGEAADAAFLAFVRRLDRPAAGPSGPAPDRASCTGAAARPPAARTSPGSPATAARRPRRHWHDRHNRCFGLQLAGDAETLLLLANAHDQPDAVSPCRPAIGGACSTRRLPTWPSGGRPIAAAGGSQPRVVAARRPGRRSGESRVLGLLEYGARAVRELGWDRP